MAVPDRNPQDNKKKHRTGRVMQSSAGSWHQVSRQHPPGKLPAEVLLLLSILTSDNQQRKGKEQVHTGPISYSLFSQDGLVFHCVTATSRSLYSLLILRMKKNTKLLRPKSCQLRFRLEPAHLWCPGGAFRLALLLLLFLNVCCSGIHQEHLISSYFVIYSGSAAPIPFLSVEFCNWGPHWQCESVWILLEKLPHVTPGHFLFV